MKTHRAVPAPVEKRQRFVFGGPNMILNVLAIGNVVGESRLDCPARRMRSVKRHRNIHFTVVNRENASGASILSRQTQARIDREVVDLVRRQHDKAVRILTENREKLDELSEFLYEKETITGEEFMNILNR